jgi:hypothetical protein
MTLSKLFQLVPPPELPVGNKGNWLEVERALGTALPQDYKAFVSNYGSGSLDSFIRVLTPFSRNRFLNLLEQGRETLNAFQVTKREIGHPSLPLFPDAGGLLQWGQTDNGDLLCWLADGDPAGWRSALLQARGVRMEIYRESMTSLLEGLLSSRNRSALLPDDFPSDSPKFNVASG